MRMGLMVGGQRFQGSLPEMVATGRDLEARGFDTLWIPHVFGLDAITLAALVGRETTRIELGTSVVPTYPRHPTAMGQQAFTAGIACGGRFTLGIGLSHPPVIERMLGLSYARRVAHMREYVEVLRPLLEGQPAKFAGEEFRVDFPLHAPPGPRVPLLLAALGERMLELAGRCSEGTLLWMVGPRTIERHVAPRIRAAARAAGRREPRIVAGVHVALVSDVDAARARLDDMLGMYRMMPSYRAMLDLEDARTIADVALVGDEPILDAGLRRLRDLGVTDFEASIVAVDGDTERRTLDYLESRIAGLRST
ncbi:MAG: TIGR03564 family F420-dependent LLM class oxidoreductase [Holophagales bacterium]|nr:TIGR03564 family F420-dependent LLM class oxidoreductase [Holophagales bacterium]